MTWAERVGNFARGVVVLIIDLATIFTELLKQTAIHLDQWADDLKEAVEKDK